jgi:hypothetical protein
MPLKLLDLEEVPDQTLLPDLVLVILISGPEPRGCRVKR